MKFKFKKPNEPSGWIEVKLNSTEMDYLQKRIEAADAKNEDVRKELVGQISSSLDLDDPDDYFNDNVIMPLADYFFRNHPEYGKVVSNNFHSNDLNTSKLSLKLDKWWVNRQKQYEYNPIHDHSGIFSFAIWMSEPADYREQSQKENAVKSNHPQNNVFSFHYLDMFGHPASASYGLDKSKEGSMLFFPAKLHHSVNPFFDNDDIRISIAGNVAVMVDKQSQT